jgi:hypothetical protein
MFCQSCCREVGTKCVAIIEDAGRFFRRVCMCCGLALAVAHEAEAAMDAPPPMTQTHTPDTQSTAVVNPPGQAANVPPTPTTTQGAQMPPFPKDAIVSGPWNGFLPFLKRQE